MNYENPIIKGFYPDPSVCRANGKYYMICSSMHYFPSIPLFESTDMVNWKQIGWCLTRKSQINLEEVPSSGGIFAPTIRYYKGIFYVVTTNDSQHKNFFVTTTDIYGEWSEPIYVEQGGIDPSLYFEGDKVYFTSNGRDEEHIPCIYQCEIDIETGQLVSDSKIIWKGSGGRLVEGPHLYKIEKYYYLMAAEGGTEYGHMVTYGRSSSPYGPFENYRYNPVLTNRNLGDDEIQGAGHGDLIEDYNGNWWIVHLAFRQLAKWKQYHHLGREVFLMPVKWNKDGWFTIGERGIAEKNISLPFINEKIEQVRKKEINFTTRNWDFSWSYLRRCNHENYKITIGKVEIKGSDYSLNDKIPSLIGIRQQDFECRLCVKVEVPHGEAGVTIYMDERHHYDVAVVKNAERAELLIRLCIGGITEEKRIKMEKNEKIDKAELIVYSERNKYSMQIKTEGKIRIEHQMESKYLSSEVAGGFTGVLFGLYAFNQQNDLEEKNKWCKFTEFSLVLSN